MPRKENETRGRPFLALAAILFFLAFFPDSALAETELPDVVVTANKKEVPQGDIAASVTVITRREIESQKAATVPEVLRNTVGVQMTSVGSPGDDVDVRLRGADRDEVLVMIDGVPINSVRERRALFLGTVPLDNVERIEVVRGSQSVLYGSDAVGGVINVITRKGEEKNRLGVWFEGGNLQTFREGVEGGGRVGHVRYSGSVSRTDQRGRFDRDRFGETAVSANVGYQILPSLEMTVGADYHRSDQELFYEFQTAFDPATVSLMVQIDPDSDNRLHRDDVVGRVSFKAVPKPWWEAQLHYGLLIDLEHVQNTSAGDAAPAGFVARDQDFKGNGRRNTADLRNFFTWWETPSLEAQLTVGFEFEDERFKFTDAATGTAFPGPGQEGDRQNYAPYLQQTLRLLEGDLILTGGTRFDHNTAWGDQWSPAGSVLYKLKKTGTTFRGSYGEGFHGPTVLEFFNQVLLETTGDPAFQAVRLQPELSQSYEAGIDQRIGPAEGFPRALASAAFFYVDYDRLFDGLQFIGDAFGTGVEAGLTVEPLSWLQIGGNYTFLHAQDETNRRRLADRPRHQGNFFLQARPVPRLNVRADVNVVGNRRVPDRISTAAGDLNVVFIDPAGNTSANGTVPGYVKVDLAASYALFENRGALDRGTLYFKIENLLDDSYQEKFGFPAPGITFLAGLKANF